MQNPIFSNEILICRLGDEIVFRPSIVQLNEIFKSKLAKVKNWGIFKGIFEIPAFGFGPLAGRRKMNF